MRSRVLFRLGGALAACLLVLGACSSEDESSSDSSSDTTEASSDAVKVGIALSAAKNDNGFSQAHYDGLVAACEELGCEVAVAENADDPQKQIDALKNLAADNDVVIGVGAEFASAGTSVAPQFPDTQFSIINGETSEAENLHVYVINQGYAAYVAGAVAGTVTQTDTVGYLGGLDIPPTAGSEVGFELGAQSTNPDVTYLSALVGDFTDSAKAKELAAQQIAEGADVIYAYLDSATEGVVEAIEESGKDVKLITQAVADCDVPGVIIAGTTLSTTAYVATMVTDFTDDTLPTEPKVFALEDPEIQRVDLCSDQPAELQAVIDEATAGLNDGTIELPDTVI